MENHSNGDWKTMIGNKEYEKDLKSFPPGYRFEPEDHELLNFYLIPKINHEELPPNLMHEIDLYQPHLQSNPEIIAACYEPQGEGKWYFFTPRDRKYPNGSRPNRAAGDGYWKATGVDKPVSSKDGSEEIGSKKSLVFYRGKAPHGDKTNWIMHEFRVAEHKIKNVTQSYQANDRPYKRMKLDDWVLCRIYHKDEKSDKITQPRVPKKEMKQEQKDQVHSDEHPSETSTVEYAIPSSFVDDNNMGNIDIRTCNAIYRSHTTMPSSLTSNHESQTRVIENAVPLNVIKRYDPTRVPSLPMVSRFNNHDPSYGMDLFVAGSANNAQVADNGYSNGYVPVVKDLVPMATVEESLFDNLEDIIKLNQIQEFRL